MHIFIAGASGIVGRDLADLCNKENISWTGSYNMRPFDGGVKVDFLDFEAVKNAFQKSGTTCVVNCIVERFTDVCEKDWSKTVIANINIPEIIARACNELGIHLIHISTDYVFDGRHPPYFPSSQTNPLQNYGISKLIAEQRIKAFSGLEYSIVRVPVLYTDSYKYLDETAITTIAKKVMNMIDCSKEDNVSVRRPVYIPDFCDYILHIARDFIRGTFHFYNETNKTTKYEMAKMIGDYLRLPTNKIEPVNSFGADAANRPIDTQLINMDDNEYIGYKGLSIRDGIEKCFKRYWFPRLKEEPSKFLLLFDLDGTLVDTETLHYEAYKSVLGSEGIDITRRYFDDAVNCMSTEEMLRGLGISNPSEIREKKTRVLCESDVDIKLIKGAKEVIELASGLGIEMAVCTNTSLDVVESFKTKCPELGLIKNWITRADYEKPKPYSDCYEMAVKLLGSKKEYILAFENTVNGAKAALGVTNKVFCISNKNEWAYSLLKQLDCFLIPDFTSFLEAHC